MTGPSLVVMSGTDGGMRPLPEKMWGICGYFVPSSAATSFFGATMR